MTAAMWAALPGILAPLADDADVRVLVVTGSGPSFCAGADISDLLSGPDTDDPMAVVRRDNLAAQAALREFPKPTVATIRGHCIGGGVEIAACCDLRFADPTAVFEGHAGEGRHRLHAVVHEGPDRPGRPVDDRVPPLQRRADQPIPFRSPCGGGTRVLRRSPPETGIGPVFRRAADCLPARP